MNYGSIVREIGKVIRFCESLFSTYCGELFDGWAEFAGACVHADEMEN